MNQFQYLWTKISEPQTGTEQSPSGVPRTWFTVSLPEPCVTQCAQLADSVARCKSQAWIVGRATLDFGNRSALAAAR